MATIHPSPTALLAVNNTFLGVAAVTICLRLYVRKVKQHFWRAEDYVIILAFGFHIAVVALINVAVNAGGLGQHTKDLSQGQLTTLAQMTAIVAILWRIVLPLPKISIVIFYKSIFPDKLFQLCSNVVLACLGTAAVATFLSSTLICIPFQKQWKPSTPGTCGSQADNWLAAGIIDFIFDIVLIILPMKPIWGLHMKFGRKMGLTVIFGIGLLTCIITIFRILGNKSVDHSDPAYSTAGEALWAGVEPVLLIINASLPFMPQVLSQASREFITSIFSRGSGTQRRLLDSRRQPDKRFSGGSQNQFKRLHDHLFPLSNLDRTLPNGGNNVEITPATPKAGSTGPSESGDVSKIHITNEFEVTRA